MTGKEPDRPPGLPTKAGLLRWNGHLVEVLQRYTKARRELWDVRCPNALHEDGSPHVNHRVSRRVAVDENSVAVPARPAWKLADEPEVLEKVGDSARKARSTIGWVALQERTNQIGDGGTEPHRVQDRAACVTDRLSPGRLSPRRVLVFGPARVATEREWRFAAIGQRIGEKAETPKVCHRVENRLAIAGEDLKNNDRDMCQGNGESI